MLAQYGCNKKIIGLFLLALAMESQLAVAGVDPVLGGLTLGVPIYQGKGDNAVELRLIYDGRYPSQSSVWGVGTNSWSTNYSLIAETGDVSAYPNGDLTLLEPKSTGSLGGFQPGVLMPMAAGGEYFYYGSKGIDGSIVPDWAANNLYPRVRISSPVGQIAGFKNVDGAYVPDSVFTGVLKADGVNYYYSTASGTVYVFNKATGRLSQIKTPAGATQDLQYRPDGLLGSVTDAYGRSLTFTYTTVGSDISTLTAVGLPGGKTVALTYGADASDGLPHGPLSRIDFANGTAYTFEYDAAYQLLAKLTTTAGLVKGSWEYDGLRRVKAYAGQGGNDAYTLQYQDSNTPGANIPLGTRKTIVSSLVTKRLGDVPAPMSWTYTFQIGNGKWIATNVDRENGPFLGEGFSGTAFDGFGNKTGDSNMNDRVTDASGLLKQIKGGSYELPLAFEYADPTMTKPELFKKPSTITHGAANSAQRITSYEYDANGDVKSVTETDPATSRSRVTTYTRDALGYVLTIKGPNTVRDDTRTYTYDSQHNVSSYTDAAGYKTVYSNYDADGRVGKITLPNGLVTTYTYDPATSRLAEKNIAGQIYSYAYDTNGRLLTTTRPDGVVITNVWDGRGQLVEQKDSNGNRYTLDLNEQGKVLREQYVAPGAAPL